MITGYMTYALDMAMKRQAYHISLIHKLADAMLYQLIMVNVSEKESRIVNKSGQVVGVYEHQ